MSQPKRYAIDSDGVPYPLDTGDYVRHSDYAALAAENSSLESFLKWKGLREEYQQWLDWRAER